MLQMKGRMIMKKMLACLLALFMCMGFCAIAEEGQRIEAAEFVYELAEGDELYVENLIFNQDVTVAGDYGQIIFANCEFGGDIINTAANYTRVMLLPDCVVNGKCILRNGNTEGHLVETALPKFISLAPVEVECDGCYGALIALGDFEVVFNGESYTMADAGIFFDNSAPELGFVPYKDQPANCFSVIQWWEMGMRILLVECEYDPTM